MTLQALPPVREALEAHGLWANKAFGQHFLLDLNITRKIARLAQVGAGDHVIEVGPGPGGLTRALLETGAKVTAIETDQRFRPLLDDISVASGCLTVIFEDALKVDYTDLAADQPAHIVANLPYNVGTPLLIKWLTGPWSPRSMTLMFQREVADRITEGPSEDAYGRLAVIVQAVCHAERVMDVPARAFTPPPKVESAVVVFTPRDRPEPACSVKTLSRVTAAAFGQRRKMLRASLKQLMPMPELLLKEAGIDPTKRAEDLPVSAFATMAAILDRGGPGKT